MERIVSIDLNLLVALDALLETHSVSGAAQRMHLSEPAMSRTLSRLRTTLGDPVLVRSGRAMVPTPRALALRTEVADALTRARAVFAAPGPVDLTTLDRTFTLLASDAATAIGASLMRYVHEDAPLVRVRFLSEGTNAEAARLRDGDVDLDVGVIDATAPEIRTEALARDRMVPVVRSGHPLANGTLRLDRFADAAHVSASRRGRLTGPLDEALAAHGLTRRVTVAAPTYAAALLMVATTDLVGLTADRLSDHAIGALGLVRLELPLDLPPIELGQAWHARYDQDPAHRWLRSRVRAAVNDLFTRPATRQEPPPQDQGVTSMDKTPKSSL